MSPHFKEKIVSINPKKQKRMEARVLPKSKTKTPSFTFWMTDLFDLNSSAQHAEIPTYTRLREIVVAWGRGNNSYKNKGKLRAFRDLLVFLYGKGDADMILKPEYINALAHIVAYYKDWLRELKQWQQFTRVERLEWEISISSDTEMEVVRKKYASLIKHLFVRYPVPQFLENTFFMPASEGIDWYVKLGRGESLYKTATFPIKMTPKMLHYFLQAPLQYNLTQALRMGQILGMGGTQALVNSILATRLANDFENETFWETFLHFCVQNPMMDYFQVPPMIDFLQSEKFEERTVMVQRGVLQSLPPPQPDFSMKGRTPASMIRLVEAWHERINQQNDRQNLYNRNPHLNGLWSGFKMKDFSTKISLEKEAQTFMIMQLLTYNELSEEGRNMHHCVSTYASSCEEGRTSIWSLRESLPDNQYKILVTIELNSGKTIVQIRGAYNAYATDEAMMIIRMWAAEEGLRFSNWL